MMAMRLLVVLLLLASPLHGRWWKLYDGTFTVYSDASERAARETLARLQLARRAFSYLGDAAIPFPVIAYTLASESRFRAIRPGAATRGFYQSGAQRDYIVLSSSDGDTQRITFHEFSHLVFNHTLGPLPQWLEEGMAEFHSTLAFDGDRLRLGVPVANHLRLLAANPLFSAAELSGITKNSPQYNESSRAGVFYAQSWAMVHMLRAGEGYREHFNTFLNGVQSGEAVPAAFQRAFGKSFSEAVAGLRAYLARPGLPVLEYTTAAQRSAPPVQVESLSDAEGDLVYSELALDAGHAEEAAKIYRRLARSKPDSARTAAALGAMALGQKEYEQAKRYFEQAMHYPDAPAEVFFESAMLLRDRQGSRAEVTDLLRKALERNPKYAEAHFLLGIQFANDNRHEDAIRHLQQAAAVFPRQSYFWHALAISYHALGRMELTHRAAQRALDSASNAEQAEMARAALRLASTAASEAKPKGPDVVTPDSWKNKQGDARVEGILERIECLGANARFHVRTGGKITGFFVENPGEVLLKNLSSVTFEFRCGPQKPVPIAVEFNRSTNVVTALEFK